MDAEGSPVAARTPAAKSKRMCGTPGRGQADYHLGPCSVENTRVVTKRRIVPSPAQSPERPAKRLHAPEPTPHSALELQPEAQPALELQPVANARPAGLSDYEQQRLDNIAKNQKQLVALGLEGEPCLCAREERKPPPPRQPRRPLPEPSRKSSRLEGSARKSYAEDGGLGAPSALAPGTALEAPRRKPKKQQQQLADPGAPAELPPPALSDEEAAAQVTATRALYKEHYLAVRATVSRPDLQAMKAVRTAGAEACVGLHVGALPGMPPGCEFHNKCEMQVCGMHRKWLSGIDYLPASASESGEATARAVVSSGGYEDDEDDGDTLWYTGSGGNDLLSSRRQTGAQKLEKGNEALANNIKSETPVRLLRYVGEVPPERSFSGRLYIYDGLYAVTDYKYEVGARSHGVFKFKLERLPGQPPLRQNASAKLHQRLIDLAHRDGTAGERHVA